MFVTLEASTAFSLLNRYSWVKFFSAYLSGFNREEES